MAEVKQITFTINDEKLTTPAGTLVIEAAKGKGIEVPSFLSLIHICDSFWRDLMVKRISSFQEPVLA